LSDPARSKLSIDTLRSKIPLPESSPDTAVLRQLLGQLVSALEMLLPAASTRPVKNTTRRSDEIRSRLSVA
jgi:hypothetical protein